MKRSIRLDEWILLATVPTLVVMTLALGFVVYSGLYETILEGFDRKLLAGVSVTSSFIDGEDHARLLEPLRVKGLAWDAVGNRLVAGDASGRLYAVDLATGEADPLGTPAVEPFDSWALAGDSLYLLKNDPPRNAKGEPGSMRILVRAWPPRAAEAAVPWAEQRGFDVPQAITWDGERLLAVVGRDVRELSATSARALQGKTIGELPRGAPVVAMVVAGGQLLLLRSDAGSSAMVPFAPGRPLAGNATIVRGEDETPRPASAIASDGSRVFVATPEGLVHWATLPTGGPGQAEGFAKGFRSRNDPLYQQYMQPMRSLMQKQNLSYVYSQILVDQDAGRIAYVLDATEGEDQAVIGGQDTVPAEDFEAAKRVMETGSLNVGRVRRFERWGLLKVSTGPIRDAKGRSLATTGVDVNISTIREKTRSVLVQVLALGSIGLLLAAAASYGLARRLNRPLHELKGAALKVAAGQHGLEVGIDRPKEIHRISEAFNEMSRQTRETLDGLERQRREFEHKRLCRLISARLRGTPQHPVVEETYKPHGRAELVNESGHCHAGGRTFVWLTGAADRELAASRRIAVRRQLAARVLETGAGADTDAIMDELARVVPAPCLALYDHAQGRLLWRGAAETPAPTADENGRLSFAQLGPVASYKVAVQLSVERGKA